MYSKMGVRGKASLLVSVIYTRSVKVVPRLVSSVMYCPLTVIEMLVGEGSS